MYADWTDVFIVSYEEKEKIHTEFYQEELFDLIFKLS
jgi:hypothetical protein